MFTIDIATSRGHDVIEFDPVTGKGTNITLKEPVDAFKMLDDLVKDHGRVATRKKGDKEYKLTDGKIENLQEENLGIYAQRGG